MAWPFLEPVDPEDAPDYYGVIKEPMGKKLADNSCMWREEFLFMLELLDNFPSK